MPAMDTSVQLDTILPPALAYHIGIIASQKVKDIHAGIATVEGRFIQGRDQHGNFACDCMTHSLSLTEHHPKYVRSAENRVVERLRKRKEIS